MRLPVSILWDNGRMCTLVLRRLTWARRPSNVVVCPPWSPVSISMRLAQVIKTHSRGTLLRRRGAAHLRVLVRPTRATQGIVQCAVTSITKYIIRI
jgi:hypothetical protein